MLHPSPSIRFYTENAQKRFFEDENIKISLYGDSGGDMYQFYLFRNSNNRIYDIYFNGYHNKCYIIKIFINKN